MSLSIHIPQFEGPLGLLLYLIRKEEMDIFDIDVTLITSQYLDYIKKMKQFDLEVAGDFIAMAATLIQIKSKMLLPNYNEEGDVEEVEDPRKELVQRLIEYQKFQEVSKDLYNRPLLGRDVYKRGKGQAFLSDEEGEIILDEGGLFSLIAYYRNSVRKMKKAIHRVARKTRSIAGRIMEIKDKFIVGQRIILRDLLQDAEDAKNELLITFLSCLEMGKMGLVSVYQAEVYGDIYLTAKREITADAIGRVEEYESHDAEDVAASIMEEAEEDAAWEAEEQAEQLALGQNTNEESEMDLASDDEILAAEQELNIENEGALPQEMTMAEAEAPLAIDQPQNVEANAEENHEKETPTIDMEMSDATFLTEATEFVEPTSFEPVANNTEIAEEMAVIEEPVAADSEAAEKPAIDRVTSAESFSDETPTDEMVAAPIDMAEEARVDDPLEENSFDEEVMSTASTEPETSFVEAASDEEPSVSGLESLASLEAPEEINESIETNNIEQPSETTETTSENQTDWAFRSNESNEEEPS